MRVGSFPFSCNPGLTRAFFSFAVLIVFAALLSVPSLAPYPIHRPRPHNAPRAQQVSQGTPREIDFPYYSLREGYTSLLQLVSDSTVSLPITLTVRSLSGRNVLTKQMTIQSQEKLMIDLSTLLESLGAANVDDFQEGSISVSYASDTRPIMGQVTVTNPYLDLIFESRLAINDPGDSNIPATLEGIWWGLMPGRQTKVMVTNTSNSPVSADVSLTFGGQRHSSNSIIFQPYETKVLSIKELLAKLNADAEHVSEGGITISGRSSSPALIATGMTADPGSGFSTTMHFPPAGTPQTSTLFAPGVPIGTPSADSPFSLAGAFTPHVIVRNLSSSLQTAAITIEYPTASGPQSITLDPVNLGAYSTKDVPLDSTIIGRLPLPLPYCSIQLQYSGSPGSAMAEISSVEDKQDLVVDSKLGDPGDHMSGSGINPWHLDDQTESVLFLTNEGAAPARVAFQIQAQGTVYHLTDLKLNPHETRAIDIRKLRDAQKPDLFGNKIPAKATDGSLYWVKMDKVPMIGRTLVFSSRKGISSNFDCGCIFHCAIGYIALAAAPASATVAVGNSQQFTATETWEDCNGLDYFYDETFSSTWSVPSGCSVNAGSASCSVPGSATITASYTDSHYHWSAAQQVCIEDIITRSASGTLNVTPSLQLQGNQYIFVGTDPNLAPPNSIFATVSPSGGTFTESSSNSSDTFAPVQSGGPGWVVNTTTQSTNTGDRKLTVTYTVNTQKATQSLNVTARQFAYATNNSPSNTCTLGYGTTRVYTYTPYTHPDKTAVQAGIGLTNTPVTESFNPQPPTGTVTGSGALDANSLFTDRLAYCSSSPLTLSTSVTQTISIEGYQVRQNLLTYSSSGLTLTNQGPTQ